MYNGVKKDRMPSFDRQPFTNSDLVNFAFLFRSNFLIIYMAILYDNGSFEFMTSSLNMSFWNLVSASLFTVSSEYLSLSRDFTMECNSLKSISPLPFKSYISNIIESLSSELPLALDQNNIKYLKVKQFLLIVQKNFLSVS